MYDSMTKPLPALQSVFGSVSQLPANDPVFQLLGNEKTAVFQFTQQSLTFVINR